MADAEMYVEPATLIQDSPLERTVTKTKESKKMKIFLLKTRHILNEISMTIDDIFTREVRGVKNEEKAKREDKQSELCARISQLYESLGNKKYAKQYADMAKTYKRFSEDA